MWNNASFFVLQVCPPGWFYYKESCYFVHGAKLPFAEAKAKCQSLDSKLFEPMSEEQNEDIFNIMLSMLGEDTEYYVGISIDDATDSGRYSFYFTYSFLWNQSKVMKCLHSTYF